MESENIRAGLARAKARGIVIGRHGKVLARQNQAEADRHAMRIAPMVRSLQVEHRNYRALTAAMNEEGVPTMRGGVWHLPGVHRLCKRLDSLSL